MKSLSSACWKNYSQIKPRIIRYSDKAADKLLPVDSECGMSNVDTQIKSRILRCGLSNVDSQIKPRINVECQMWTIR